MAKFIFVLGGSISSLGKGILISSVGNLLEATGKKVSLMKIDPYLNLGSGELSLQEHGEVYILPDGWKCDLDLGNYYRYTHTPLNKNHSVSAGRVWKQVLENTENKVYGGKTIQIVPHVTDEIRRRIQLVADQNKVDYVLVELGGTVGDLESDYFIEAIRQMKMQLNEEEKQVEIVFLTYVPTTSNGEVKTKLTQSAVKTLQEKGIQPDILVCRAKTFLDDSLKNKISLFTNVSKNRIFTSPDLNQSVYCCPEVLEKEGLVSALLQDFKDTKGLTKEKKLKVSPQWKKTWGNLSETLTKIKQKSKKVRICLVSKNFENPDSYKSLCEALFHSSFEYNCNLELKFLDIAKTDFLNKEVQDSILSGNVDGYIIPSGFSTSDLVPLLDCLKLIKKTNRPVFGIGDGINPLILDYAGNHIDASSTVDNPHPYCVLSNIADQYSDFVCQTLENLPGFESFSKNLKRSGKFTSIIEPDSIFKQIYSLNKVEEIHNHSWEVNLRPFVIKSCSKAVLKMRTHIEFKDRKGVEFSDAFMDENKPHIFGVQFHPEFKSKLFQPHPLFVYFMEKCLENNL